MKISLKIHEHFEIDEKNPNIKYKYNEADWAELKAYLNDNTE